MTQTGSFEYALPPAIAVAVGLSIIVIVAKWAPRSPSRQAFMLMVAGLVIWAVTILGMRLSTDLSVALVWNRGAAAAIMLMFLGFYHFSLEYAGPFRQRRVLTVAYIAVAVFAMASPFGLLVDDLRIAEYGYAPVPGFLAIPASGTALALLLAGVYVLLRRYRMTSSYEEKNRLLYLMAGASLPLIGTLIDIFTNLPPVGIWTSILFCTVTGVALLKYRLLDIPHVARRTLTY
ncbi:MAG: histidine kinase N-terminal 7TM domain-containing protein, partial [Chloroflexota bacterium]